MRFRAAAVVLGGVAACGDGLAPPEAAPPIDGPAGNVRVRYLGGDAPTVQVLFQNADSTLVLAARTGADGTANAYMAPGGFVSVIASGLSGTTIHTWADVQPGDELLYGGNFFDPPGVSATSFAVTVPVDPGQDDYRLHTACGWSQLSNPGAPSPVTLTNCGPDQHLLALSTAFATSTEHYLFRPDTILTGFREIDGPWRPFDTARVEVSGMPAGQQAVNATMVLLDDGYPINLSERGGSGVLAGGAGVVELAAPLPDGAGLRVVITPSFQPEQLSSLRAVHWGPMQRTMRFDLGRSPLRTYREFPTYLRGQHAIRWTEEGAGEAPDAVMTGVHWYTADFFSQVTWMILAPGSDEATVQLPRLPLAELMPQSDAVLDQPTTLTTFRLDSGGYARVKNALSITWGSGLGWPMDADEGTVVIQELGSPQFPF